MLVLTREEDSAEAADTSSWSTFRISLKGERSELVSELQHLPPSTSNEALDFPSVARRRFLERKVESIDEALARIVDGTYGPASPAAWRSRSQRSRPNPPRATVKSASRRAARTLHGLLSPSATAPRECLLTRGLSGDPCKGTRRATSRERSCLSLPHPSAPIRYRGSHSGPHSKSCA
jgi:hypothetical protein